MPFRLLKQDERNFYSVHISAFFFCVEELFGQAASTHPTNGSTHVGLTRVGFTHVQAHSECGVRQFLCTVKLVISLYAGWL